MLLTSGFAACQDQTIRVEDGDEATMGRWSLLVGERFLEWIQAPRQSSWLDVGCGNGALMALVLFFVPNCTGGRGRDVPCPAALRPCGHWGRDISRPH